MENKKRIITLSVLFVLLVIFAGVGISYAYFQITVTGTTETPEATAANMNITTNLDDTSIIDSRNIALIDSSEYLTKAEKLSFTVTNNIDSTVQAKYTVKLVDTTITKNLISKYFKWALVVNHDTTNPITGTFEDSSLSTEGTIAKDVIDISKYLIDGDNARTIDINTTDSIDFYIWLENDPNVDQLYLTEGAFQSKVSVDAIPYKNN